MTRASNKWFIIYCSIVPADFPPDWLLSFAKQLSIFTPVLFVELAQGNRTKKSRLEKIQNLLRFLFAHKKFQIWENYSLLANIGLFLKFLLMRISGYEIVLITSAIGERSIYSYIPATAFFLDFTDHYRPGDIQNKKQLKFFDEIFVNSEYLRRIMLRHSQHVTKISTGYIKRPYPLQEKNKIPNSVIYLGGISRRIDFDLLLKVIQTMPSRNFFFAGQIYLQKYYVSNNRRNVRCRKLWKKILLLPNVYYLGEFLQSNIVEKLSYFQVGIIPYDARDYMTQHSNPIKLYEYLYNKLPVVSSPLPTVMEKQRGMPIYIADSTNDFVKNIRAAFNNKPIEIDRRKLYNEHALQTKTQQVLNIIQLHFNDKHH